MRVYFITDGKYIKIGSSENPEQRLKQLQTGNALSLKIIKSVEAPKTFENYLHFIFKSKKINSEWFLLDDNDYSDDTIGGLLTEYETVEEDSSNYFNIYFKNLDVLYTLTSAKEILLIFHLCEIAEYNTGVVYLTTERRKQISGFLSVNNSYLSNCLSKLKSKGLITGKQGTYQVNPEVFWKGSNKERYKLLKEKGIKINIEFKAE